MTALTRHDKIARAGLSNRVVEGCTSEQKNKQLVTPDP